MNRNFTAYWDIDYFHKLSSEDADYLTRFMNEYYLGDFHGVQINPDKRECYRRRHRERRDVYRRSDPQTNETIDFLSRVMNPEDAIIQLLDEHRKMA
jgi:hypothetical protein